MSTLSNPLRPMIGFALVEAVRVAERAGVLDALEEPATAAELARRLELSERALGLMLPILCKVGYLERFDAIYRRRKGSEEMLELLPMLDAFAHGAELPDRIDQTEQRGDYYAKTVLHLAEMFAAPARDLAEKLAPVARIADVGAGSGIWSLAMAACSDAQVIAIDRPEVLPATRRCAIEMKLEDRLSVRGADYFEASLDAPVDRIVLANVLHLEDEAGARALVARYADMLTEDGELVIVDCFGAEGFEPEISAAAYDLHLGMRTSKGRAHDIELLRSWCNDAGLVAQQVIRLEQAAMAALVCSRREVTLQARPSTTIAASDLQALRDEAAANRARMDMTFEGCADALLVIDKQDLTVLRTNDALRKLFGLRWGSLDVRNLDELIAPDELARFEQVVCDLAAGVVTERRYRVRMMRNGVPFTAEVTAYDPLARSVIIFTVRDHDKLARREKLEALGELVGGLTHDLNTPLGSLKSNCALAMRLGDRLESAGTEPRAIETLRATLNDALAAADEMARKLDAIKAFATLEGPKLHALAPHFRDGVAHAIIERAASDAASD